MGSYFVHEGIVVGRKAELDGTLFLRFVTPGGSLEAKARKGTRANARSARLSLFHHVRFQVYGKGGGTPSLTEVELVGKLFGLEEPRRFLMASFLGELAYRLASPEAAPQVYPLLASGLRGVAKHPDPEVPFLWAGWRILKGAGLAPRLEGEGERLRGGVLGRSGVFLGREGVERLRAVLRLPGKEAVALLEEGDRTPLWEALLAHAEEVAGPLKSLPALGRKGKEPLAK